MMIYLDNASTTQMSDSALAALLEVSKRQYGNASTIYGFGKRSKKVLDEARSIIAKCIGATDDEIFFTSGGTESDNWAIHSAMDFDKLIISSIEHHAVLRPAENINASGHEVIILPVGSDGHVSEESLRCALEDGKRAFVSIMLQNNETGVFQDIPSFAKLTHQYNSMSVFHTDAVQACGHKTICVSELGVDLLSASAHKFNGPKGIGFLYIRKGCSIKPLMLGGGQEKGFRSGTENVAGIFSMAKALEDNTIHITENEEHIFSLEELLYSELLKAGIKYNVNGDKKRKAAGIINLAIEGADGEGLLNMLDLHGICVSLGSACNSKTKRPSHVLTAMGLDTKLVDSSIRISIGKYNSKPEIFELVKRIKQYMTLADMAKANNHK